MNNSILTRRIGLALFLVGGVAFMLQERGPAPESIARQTAIRALAPAGSRLGQPSPADADAGTAVIRGAPVEPAYVDMADVAAGPAEVDRMLERYLAGEMDFDVNEGPVGGGARQALLAEALALPFDPTVQNYDPSAPSAGSLMAGASFKSIDYTQSQQGVPPDPDIMVGNDHIVVGVNTSFQVFDKSGTSLVGPTLYESFWGNNCGTGSANMVFFDPYSVYDEEEYRYVMGITAYDSVVNGGDNGYACIAVSTTDSATGGWHLYSFDGNPGVGLDYFFDYPHIGVGQDALYMGANMFGASFVRNHILAFEKDVMYAGGAANYVKLDVGSSYFTLQPAKIKGFLTGGWPTDANEPHYFVDAQFGNNQTQLTVWEFTDPWGTPAINIAGTLVAPIYSLPVAQPQSGGSNIEGNDNRLLDVEYWAGKLWATHTIGCNPGGGTVNCIRWYEIDVSGALPTLVQSGTFSGGGEYRSFPDLAVNKCGDMLVGYTKTSSSTFPSVYVAGRESGDAAGTLKSETLLKAGEASYTAYDSVPHRWGDYTGMALDPDGVTFWYLGEYSRPQATARWSTWVGAFTWSDCAAVPDYALVASPASQAICAPADAVFDVDLTALGGFSDPVTLSASGHPAGSSATFAPPTVTPTGSSVLTIGNTGAASAGAYSIDIVGNGGGQVHTATIGLQLDTAVPGAATLNSPADGAINVSTAPALSWTAVSSATGYDVDVATDPAFSNIVASATGLAVTSYSPPPLTDSTVYHWRVRPANNCGSGGYSSATFRTAGSSCTVYDSTDVPQVISASGTPSVSSTLSVAGAATVQDVNVLNLIGTHTYINDLDFNLQSPGGTWVEIMAQSCGSEDNFDINLDDEAAPGSWPCPPTGGGTHQPSNLLNAFDGQGANGTWTLRIDDNANLDGGALTGWSLEICSEGNTPAADYSDAAGTFGVAWHNGVGTLRLGANWDADSGFGSGGDDGTDDGVAFAEALVAASPTAVDITVTRTDAGSDPAWFTLWIDFNNDGDFEDAGEKHINRQVLVGVNNLTVDTPAAANVGTPVHYRARLYDSATEPTAPLRLTATPDGGATGGEVTDGATPPPTPTAVTLLPANTEPAPALAAFLLAGGALLLLSAATGRRRQRA